MPLGVGRGQNIGLRDFCHISTLLPLGGIRVSQTHVLLEFFNWGSFQFLFKFLSALIMKAGILSKLYFDYLIDDNYRHG